MDSPGDPLAIQKAMASLEKDMQELSKNVVKLSTEIAGSHSLQPVINSLQGNVTKLSENVKNLSDSLAAQKDGIGIKVLLPIGLALLAGIITGVGALIGAKYTLGHQMQSSSAQKLGEQAAADRVTIQKSLVAVDTEFQAYIISGNYDADQKLALRMNELYSAINNALLVKETRDQLNNFNDWLGISLGEIKKSRNPRVTAQEFQLKAPEKLADALRVLNAPP